MEFVKVWMAKATAEKSVADMARFLFFCENTNPNYNYCLSTSVIKKIVNCSLHKTPLQKSSIDGYLDAIKLGADFCFMSGIFKPEGYNHFINSLSSSTPLMGKHRNIHLQEKLDKIDADSYKKVFNHLQNLHIIYTFMTHFHGNMHHHFI